MLSFARGRGAALADFNLDGLLDLVEVNYRRPVRLWRNVGSGDAAKPAPMGHWLALRLTPAGPEPRRDRRLDRGPGRRPITSGAS